MITALDMTSAFHLKQPLLIWRWDRGTYSWPASEYPTVEGRTPGCPCISAIYPAHIGQKNAILSKSIIKTWWLLQKVSPQFLRLDIIRDVAFFFFFFLKRTQGRSASSTLASSPRVEVSHFPGTYPTSPRKVRTGYLVAFRVPIKISQERWEYRSPKAIIRWGTSGNKSEIRLRWPSSRSSSECSCRFTNTKPPRAGDSHTTSPFARELVL